MTEAIALHVLVRNLDNQLEPQRFPRQILALAPAALAARHATVGCALSPSSPRMSFKRALTIRLKKGDQFASFCFSKTCADTHVLQPALGIVEAEQQGTDECAVAILVPAETRDDAVTVAFVLHLQHAAFVGLVRS